MTTDKKQEPLTMEDMHIKRADPQAWDHPQRWADMRKKDRDLLIAKARFVLASIPDAPEYPDAGKHAPGRFDVPRPEQFQAAMDQWDLPSTAHRSEKQLEQLDQQAELYRASGNPGAVPW